jgi:hypothetical protein
VEAEAVEVDCYDITVVSTQTGGGSVLLISVYDARDGENEGERETQLAHKLELVESTIRKVREEAKQANRDLEVIIVADLNRYHIL